MKRFYKQVTTQPGTQGVEICLDAKPVKTPAGQALAAPNEKLAALIAAEWQAQEGDIDPETMPLTQILTTAQDRVSAVRQDIERSALNYLDTDLLCYRAAEPVDLATAQAASGDRWLDWFAQEYNGVRLETTTGLAALSQPAAAHEAVRQTVTAMDDHRFTVLQMLTSQAGSLVLALAFVKGALSPDDLFDTIHVEEQFKAALYNEALYGAAPHEEKKRAALKRDFVAARTFLDALAA